MQAATSSALATSNPRFLWNEIVRWTYETCILRKEGKEDRVSSLLQDRLPTLIRAWSSRSGLAPDACKEQLRALFNRVQEQVELGFIQRRLIVEEVCSRLGTKAFAAVRPPTPASVGLRRRVPLDDIPDMLDALAEAEFEAMGEAVLPVRRALSATFPRTVAETAEPVALSA